MISTVITQVSEILTDEHGYTYIEISFENGVQGFFPNKVEYLGLFYEGMEVQYRDVKNFNNKQKIIGLSPVKNKTENKMLTAKIKNVGEWKFSTKTGKFHSIVTIEDDTSGMVAVDNLDATLDYKVGNLMSFDIQKKEGKDTVEMVFFVGVTLFTYSAANQRDLSIKKQTAFKAAVDLLNANPHKGRWHKAGSSTGLDHEALLNDVRSLTEILFTVVE